MKDHGPIFKEILFVGFKLVRPANGDKIKKLDNSKPEGGSPGLLVMGIDS